ncbi:MAG: hypothetical protein ACKOVB_10345 [Terrabacter sp.]
MDTRADRLAAAVRDHPLVLEDRAGHRCVAGAHSYLADGRVVCWVLPSPSRPSGTSDATVGHAIDAELAHQRVPPRVGERWGQWAREPERFWDLWCATEVYAKLAHVPMVLLARRAPVTESPARGSGVEVHWVVRRVDDVVVAQGMSWATPD